MTNEEIKAAVLEECKRLCLNDGDEFLIIDGLHLRNNGNGFEIWTRSPMLYVHENASDLAFNVAYRLLGLEAKAKGAEISRLQSEISILQGERKIAEYFSLPKTIEDLEPFLLTLLSSHSIRISEGVRAIRNAFDELTSVKDAEIQRLRAALKSTQQHAENVREEWGGVDDDLDSDLAGMAETARIALKGGTND